MSTMKRYVSLLLVLCFLLTAIPVTAQAATGGSCGENVTWSLSEDGVLTISGTGPMEDNFPTPWYDDRSSISSVIIENGVTTIGYAAFHSCDSLTAVEIPNSVATIGDQAFLGCESLTALEIPDSVTAIGDAAFESCRQLTGVDTGDGVTTIGKSAFSGCEKLISVEIGDSVTIIGDFAFYGCRRLTGVEIPDSVTTIGDSAFSGCNSLTGVVIGNNVTTIGDYAFATCESLASVEIPNSVTDIGWYAFLGCSRLASVEIPDSVTTIGDSAFHYCYGLTSVKFYGDAPDIGDDAFLDVTATSYYPANNPTWTGDVMGNYGGNITWVPYESIVGGSCGENVTWSLSEDGVLTISGTGPMDSYYRNQVPWYDERSLISSVIIENGVTTIGDNAFSDCKNLTGVEIPDSVTTIDSAAFSGCSSLAGVEIPDSLTFIGEAAFYKCDSLQGFYVDVNNPKYSTDDQGVLFNKQKTILLTAPGAISGAYTIPDSVTTIGISAFSYCTNLTSVAIGSSVTAIDYYAFNRCSSLTSVVIGDSVSTIGESAFSNCESLTGVKFYGDAPEIEMDAFYNVTATAYYPGGNSTWTGDVMGNYGGNITWVPYNPDMPFSDVPMDSFYEVPVLWALENGITTGATENTFDPNGSCLRAHVVTFLHRAAGNPAPTSTNNPFTDVTSGVFFYEPVLWAVENSITNGTSPTTFGAYDNCNRAAVVTFLWRAAGSPEPASTNNPFEDVKSTDFFYKAVLWAVEKGITNGVDATHFGPTANCNRAQVVTFLYRTYMQ